jgi:2-polyprenyl-6-methoxyphenol hydroxylase-like FAD-dependent oxidoreductase
MQAPQHDVMVRGAGAVGLATALALSKLSLRVALLGDPPAAGPRADDVRAYALNAASVRLLQSLRVWDALPAATRTPVHDMRVEGDDAGAALHFSAWTMALPELAWIVDAAALDEALRTALRFAPHVDVVAQELPAQLLVVAEGKAAATRDRLGVQWHAQRYGQHAVAARLLSHQPHAGLARQWFRSPDVLALLPLTLPALPGAGPDGTVGRTGHALALVWSLPDERAAELATCDETRFLALLGEATGGAAGELTLASGRSTWPLQLAHADRIAGPGWVLVGDAAHVVHPLAGQGLNLGFADVAALADVLAARQRDEPWRPLGDARLLARYARARALPTAAMAGVTDGLLQLFASPWPLARELRNRGLGLADALPPLKRWLTRQALGA